MDSRTLHVAIIMDGNGRWATDLGLPRALGHRAGAEALRRVVEAAPDMGVETLTAYAFSADNWQRPQEEVNALMELLAWYLEDETPRMAADGVRLSVIGRRDRLPVRLLDAIRAGEAMTRHCRKIHLRLAIDYSAREAILRASQGCGGNSVTRETFEQLLGQEAPVDLLIRTGGEQRLSDFMLWECAYAELFFTRVMWPEYGAMDLRLALEHFRKRERRFGAVPVVRDQPARQERWLH